MKDKKSKGGVTKRIISGRPYYYFQWMENGKRKSKTISEVEYFKIKEYGGALEYQDASYSYNHHIK